MFPDTNSYTLSPTSYEVQAWRAFKSAYELERASFELSCQATIPAPGLADDVSNQRMAIFKIAQQLINIERDKQMDKAMAHWAKYRTMRPAQEPNA